MRAAIILMSAMALGSCAGEEQAPLVTVSEARIMALPTSAAAYFTLANSGGRDRLLSVTTGAGKASLHETIMDGDIMRMRAADEGFEIPARGRVMLSASGKHVMIQNLVRPLTPGSSARLSLQFERQGVVEVDASVERP